METWENWHGMTKVLWLEVHRERWHGTSKRPIDEEHQSVTVEEVNYISEGKDSTWSEPRLDASEGRVA